MANHNINIEPDILLRRLRYLAIFAASFATLIFSIYFLKFHGELTSTQDAWGQFGDFVGGVLNPIFSLLALLALLATFSLQIKEFGILSQQREETNNALLEQQNSSHRQVFESSFYHLLNLHNNLLQGIDLSGPKGNIKGRDCFHVFVKRLNIERLKSNKPDEIQEFMAAYDVFYQSHSREIAHYFTMLFNIFKFIENSNVENKKFYSNLVRAQLSTPETTLLFYNCLTPNGEKFKNIVEKFSLLKGLHKIQTIDKNIATQYKLDAFSGTPPALV